MSDLNRTNDYNVPLHACNGYRQDEHYWAWVRHLLETSDDPFYAQLRARARQQPITRC